jgi:1-acyl-sn-glycerol-3-phosphate acyltransferase
MAFKTSWLGKLSQASFFRQAPYFKSVLSVAYGYYAWTMFAACAATFGSVAIVLRSPDRAQQVLKTGARLLCRLCGIRLSVEGLQRLPPQPHILIVNHTSFMDPVALIALLPAKPGYRFTASQQFRRQRLLCPLVKSVGTVILKRPDQHHDLPNVALLVKALRARNNLVIFPEGGFRPEPGMQPFHSGAFVAARQANVPIVVAAIHGSAEVLRPGLWRPNKKPISVAIGPVFYPDSMIGVSISCLMNASRIAMVQLQERLESASPGIE